MGAAAFLPLLQALGDGEVTGVGAGRGQLRAALIAGNHLRPLSHYLLYNTNKNMCFNHKQPEQKNYR